MQTSGDKHVDGAIFLALFPDSINGVFYRWEDVDVLFWEGGDDTAPRIRKLMLSL